MKEGDRIRLEQQARDCEARAACAPTLAEAQALDRLADHLRGNDRPWTDRPHLGLPIFRN